MGFLIGTFWLIVVSFGGMGLRGMEGESGMEG